MSIDKSHFRSRRHVRSDRHIHVLPKGHEPSELLSRLQKRQTKPCFKNHDEFRLLNFSLSMHVSKSHIML